MVYLQAMMMRKIIRITFQFNKMASSYNPESSVVPYQMLSLREKNEKWKKASVDAFISKFYFGNNNTAGRKQQMKISYDLYNGIFDEKDLKYVTDPYKVNDSFPASLQNFNIIKPKIDLLMGEETKRPFSLRVAQTDGEATTKFQSKHKELLIATLSDILGEGDSDAPLTEEEMDKLLSVGDYMSKDYSDISETTAFHTLNYLKEKENLKYKFMEGFHDLICASMEVYYTGQLNGEPIAERVNPLFFSFDYSPEVQFIEDGEWAVRRLRMTPAAIYDRFYDIMDESDLKELTLRHSQSGYESKGNSREYNHIRWRNISVDGNDSCDAFTGNTIDVWHATWKSYKKVGFLAYLDENGEPQEEVVDETYKVQENEEVTWDWVLEVWEGYRIGDGIYVGIRPIPEQSVSIDNPNGNKLPYVGVVYNNNNTAPKSLVETMKPLQYMYIVIWYRLELAIARDKGKIINMDVTQIPKSMGVDVNKWLHYLSSAGVNLINPYEEGWDVPGREGGKASQFNQFSQVDLTMSSVISEYIGLMDKIEDMMGEISGVSRQRQGQVQSNELVGNVQQTITQSSHITEPLFFAHMQVKKRVLSNLLNIAKNVWHKSGKEKLNYIYDDVTRVFLDITDDFVYADHTIFVTDSTEENRNLEMIKNLYQPAMQNGASLSEIAEIMASNNLTDIKNKLKKLEMDRAKQEQQQQQQQQQSLMEIEKMRKEAEDNKLKLEMNKLEVTERDSIRDSETSIEVALIGADSKEVLEVHKNRIAQDKVDKETSVKREELEEQRRSNQSIEEIKRMEARNKAKQKTIN